jgi:hypothetical protein
MSKQETPGQINPGGAAYVGGHVHAGRDFIGRDQTITITNAPQGATVAEFVRLLADMRAALPQAGLDPDTAEVVDADFKVVEAQAGKEKPNGAVIVSKLEGAVKVLTAAAGAATAVEKLLPAAQKAIEWAGQLFR